MNSWIEIKPDSDFTLHNIPFGIAVIPGSGPFVSTRIGDYVVDLAAMQRLGYFDVLRIKSDIFENRYLNTFIALGKNITCQVRSIIQETFHEDFYDESESELLNEIALHHFNEVEMLLPLQIGDYTDFYSSMEHAANVGKMFRDPENALLPNWKHLPVGYHGRASSIVVSGTGIHRPKGQVRLPENSQPVFIPTRQLDFELEMAFVIGKENALGNPIAILEAEDHIFGMLLFNDLSARDIQSWEYVPLGPFLSKNFASVVSPWVVTLEALEPFRVPGPEQTPEVLPYLACSGKRNYDIHLEVILKPEDAPPTAICRSNSRYLYWNIAQQLAHHTVNGCNMRVGDLCASGTISGPDPGSFGSMLELAWRGTNPLELNGGKIRTFIDDYDTIIMKGFAEKEGIRVGFGEAVVKILPAK